MKIQTAQIKEMILIEGIDLVGIADAKTLILAYPPRPATGLMPGAKSVIVMAVAHSLGAVYSPHIRLWTRNKMQTSRLLDQTTEKIGRHLEEAGFLSLPISADKPSEVVKINPETGKKFRVPRWIGDLSLKHAAVSCGLGEIGKNNLLITPEFGPHQRLCAIVTEAELDTAPPRQLNLCKGCGRCEEACPSGAITKGGYNCDPCFVYWSQGYKRLPPASLWEWPAYLKMIRGHFKQRDFLGELGQSFITDVDCCIECMRVCPVGEKWKPIRPEALPFQASWGTLDL